MDVEDEILKVLKEDLMPLEDIRACVVARKGMQGIIPFTDEFKAEIKEVWNDMEKAMDFFFNFMQEFKDKGADKLYLEMQNWDVIYFILPGTDSALIVIVPALCNRGLLEVEVENARRRILKVLEKNNV